MGQGASRLPRASLSRAAKPRACVRFASHRSHSFTYLLLARIANVLVGFKKGPDIDCLSTPDLPVDGPVKRQFQGAPVERPVVNK